MKAKHYIYRNLNKLDYFSIKLRGLVIDRQRAFIAHDAEFRVSEAGRQRALKTRDRNVHAYVVTGKYAVVDSIDTTKLKEVTYNPFKLSSFVLKETGEPIKKAEYVYFYQGKAFIS